MLHLPKGRVTGHPGVTWLAIVVATHAGCTVLMDLDQQLPEVCPDADGDGYAAARCGGDDCDDSDASTHPGAEEACGNGYQRIG